MLKKREAKQNNFFSQNISHGEIRAQNVSILDQGNTSSVDLIQPFSPVGNKNINPYQSKRETLATNKSLEFWGSAYSQIPMIESSKMNICYDE